MGTTDPTRGMVAQLRTQAETTTTTVTEVLVGLVTIVEGLIERVAALTPTPPDPGTDDEPTPGPDPDPHPPEDTTPPDVTDVTDAPGGPAT